MNYIKKKKGFTLIEAMVVVGISGFAGSLALNEFSESADREKLSVLSNDISKVIGGMDKRLANDKFELAEWNQFQSSDYSFRNKDQVSEFLSKSLIAKNASGCGLIDGWEPQKEDPVKEAFKDSYKFVDCNLWESKLPYDLNARAELIHDGVYVTGFNLDLFFDNNADFEKNFLSFKKLVSLAKSNDEKSLVGLHNYQFVSATTFANLSTKECIDNGSGCMLRASFTGGDSSYETLAVDGSNNMIDSKVKFQKTTAGNAINVCHRYTLVGTVWQKTPSVYCGIGFGYSNPADTTSAKLDYVEVSAESVTTNRIFLDKMCQFQDGAGVMKDVPCGVYNDSGTNQVVASYDQLYATDALVNMISTVSLKTNTANVRNQLDVSGTTDLYGNLVVSGVSDFNDKVTINGALSDVNLVVESSATINDLDVSGQLNVQGVANVNGNVNIAGSLDVGNTLSTQRMKLSQTIGATDLGTSCSAYGNGTIVYFNSGSFSDLAVCANNKWKLVNTQYNQVVAFNGSCPAGFKKFTQAAGRTLMGSGSLYDTGSAQTYTYNVGDVGGLAKVGLTTAQMPAHDHKYEDVYYSERYGPLGAGSQIGSGSTDSDNNFLTRSNLSTTATGSGQAHENRMPYYVVNWCVYEE